jgi:2-(1,2-epoxy-1,2-dihydrophenyl)acetyl-CoA isomerase
VVAADLLMDEARAVAGRLAGLAPRAVALTKRALDAGWTSSFEDALELEARFQGEAGSMADHAEGIAAFLEKRPPRFSGE